MGGRERRGKHLAHCRLLREGGEGGRGGSPAGRGQERALRGEGSKVLRPTQDKQTVEWSSVLPSVCSVCPLQCIGQLPVQAGHSLPNAIPGLPILDGQVSSEGRQLPLGFCLMVIIYTLSLYTSMCTHGPCHCLPVEIWKPKEPRVMSWGAGCWKPWLANVCLDWAVPGQFYPG